MIEHVPQYQLEININPLVILVRQMLIYYIYIYI